MFRSEHKVVDQDVNFEKFFIMIISFDWEIVVFCKAIEG